MVELNTLGAAIKAANEGEANTNAFDDAEKTKLGGIATGATADQDLSGLQPLATALTNTTASYTSAEETKLSGIATGATTDQDLSGLVTKAVPINAQTGTAYTLVLTDASKYITATNGSAVTLTIPTNSSVAFPVGTQILLKQGGAGQVTVAGAGVTINTSQTLLLRAQHSGASLVKTGTDTWDLFGDLEAA